jgi:alpha-N-arabinofuranosidase
MITTNVYGIDNFVVTAVNPSGPWSDPVVLPDVHGIDPSIFFDDNGKAYILHNGEAPDKKPLYQGHRAIWILDFDPITLKTTSEPKLLVDGGTDISKKPIWIEGPHIFKKDNLYFLIAAEGGTDYDHSEVVFRSENIYGPYESYPGNPILTQRHLDKSRAYPVTNTGHADFVETQNGEWWAVFLGCRPYQENMFNTGRETFMAPVNWTADNWPVILSGDQKVSYSYPAPNLPVSAVKDYVDNGNFELTDNFDDEPLLPYWVFLRTPSQKWYSVNDGKCKITGLADSLNGTGNPSVLLRRQQHVHCTAETNLDFKPNSFGDQAGLIVFMNEKHFYSLAKTMVDGKIVIAVYKSSEEKLKGMELVSSEVLDKKESQKVINFKVEIREGFIDFLYSLETDKWKPLLTGADATFLSTQVAGGFTGAMLGIYAISGSPTKLNTAGFDWFKYSGNDPVYENIKR